MNQLPFQTHPLLDLLYSIQNHACCDHDDLIR